jgi:hypothetical protein
LRTLSVSHSSITGQTIRITNAYLRIRRGMI